MGIGLTNPATRLDVSGIIRATSNCYATSFSLGGADYNAAFGGSLPSYGLGYTAGSSTTEVIGWNAINFRTGGVGTSNSQMIISSTGNIGIRTTTPSTTLDVNGTTTLRGATSITTGGLTVAGGLAVSSGTFSIPIGQVSGTGTIFALAGNPTLSGTVACTGTLSVTGTTTLGNVTISGNTAATGDITATGSIFGASKNFIIDHPVKENAKLIHGCVEAPRYDLIYRGSTKLSQGQAIVDVCKECNTTGGLTSGTLLNLGQNFDVFLQNKSGFARLRYELVGESLTIISEDPISADEVSWMVVCERVDANIKESSNTDDNGCLVCEVESNLYHAAN